MTNEIVLPNLTNALAHASGVRLILIEGLKGEFLELDRKNLKELNDLGFGGVYVHLHETAAKVIQMSSSVDVDSVKDFYCYESNAKTDELVREILFSLRRIKTSRKCVYIDSLSSMLEKLPLSEVLRFFEFLMREMYKNHFGRVVLIFDVDKDRDDSLRFLKNMAFKVKEYVLVKG